MIPPWMISRKGDLQRMGNASSRESPGFQMVLGKVVFVII